MSIVGFIYCIYKIVNKKVLLTDTKKSTDQLMHKSSNW